MLSFSGCCGLICRSKFSTQILTSLPPDTIIINQGGMHRVLKKLCSSYLQFRLAVLYPTTMILRHLLVKCEQLRGCSHIYCPRRVLDCSNLGTVAQFQSSFSPGIEIKLGSHIALRYQYFGDCLERSLRLFWLRKHLEQMSTLLVTSFSTCSDTVWEPFSGKCDFTTAVLWGNPKFVGLQQETGTRKEITIF